MYTKSIAQMCQKRPRTGSGPHDGPVLPVWSDYVKRVPKVCQQVCQMYVRRMSKGISKCVERTVKVCQKHEEHVPQVRQTSAKKIVKLHHNNATRMSNLCRKYFKSMSNVCRKLTFICCFVFCIGFHMVWICHVILNVVVMKITLNSC